ncbi:MAG: hypothetical protein EAX95_09655 [Candidatus Thorarchaeota archaeon]|nr:hypothetical protein [Candidatus Thorarchaeota archaeon]
MTSHPERAIHQSLAFGSILYPGKVSESNSLLLAESIREFGGILSKQPIWYFTPRLGRELSSDTKDRLQNLEVDIIPFEMDLDILKFPFTGHAEAAFLAESKAIGNVDLLAWLAPNTLVLHDPKDFLLGEDVVLGYRPVHHKLLGLHYGEPPDDFWRAVYNHYGVGEKQLFPMKPHVEEKPINPYFNAGSLIIRPESRLFTSWRDSYLRIYQDPILNGLYKEDERYAIFIHQAALTGVILSRISREKMVELPAGYNYPIHLYAEDTTSSRPKELEDCITLRHETFHKDPDWRANLPVSETLKDWIAQKLLA